MKRITLIALVCTLTCVLHGNDLPGQDKNKEISPNDWMEKLKEFKSEMPRADAEKIIETVRGIKSTYDLYAMDTSDIVVYRLDERCVLVVCYEPGFPAPRTSIPGGDRPPIDGKYLKHRVTIPR
jgi:hypothetical protein